MRTLLLTAALIVGALALPVAAAPAVTKQVTPPARAYWLSDGLNKLVFWRAPASERSERPVRQ